MSGPLPANKRASQEMWVEGEERIDLLDWAAAEDTDLRAATGTSAGENLGPAIGQQGADRHAAVEARLEGPEVGQLDVTNRIEGTDVGSAARAGSGDDFGPAIAVDVAGGDENATGEARGIGKVTVEHGTGDVENRHFRTAAWAGAADELGPAGAVHVAGCDAHPAGELRVEREEVEEDGAVLPAMHDHI